MRLGIPTYGADGGRSGISAYLIELLRQFARLGVNGEVLVYPDEESIFLPPPSPPHGLAPLHTPALVRRAVPNLLWSSLALPFLCAARRYDVLFLPAANRRIPPWAPCPMVGTVHDLAAAHITDKYDKARVFYIRRVLPRLIERLQAVITISSFSKNDILEFTRVKESRIHVIPLACNHQTYFPRDQQTCYQEVQQKYHLTAPYLLYISRIEHPGKNHVGLIQAFELLKDRHRVPHQLLLAGSDWDRAEEVHQRAARSKWSQDIIFTGFVANEMIPILYGGCDLFVFPSLFEGFGLPLLEAMACGKPVLCSNRASMPEVVGKAARLFEPDDVESIVDALESVVLYPQTAENYRRLGLERSAQFSWERTAVETLRVLQNV